MRLISGGQTGVDQAGLDAGLESGIPIGGWAPKGWKAEKGLLIPERFRQFMQETPTDDYMQRTSWNVRDSNATVILYRDSMSGGTARTWNLARSRRAVKKFDVHMGTLDELDAIVAWMWKYDTVNIAGPRESKCPGIYDQAKTLLLEALSEYRPATATA